MCIGDKDEGPELELDFMVELEPKWDLDYEVGLEAQLVSDSKLNSSRTRASSRLRLELDKIDHPADG